MWIHLLCARKNVFKILQCCYMKLDTKIMKSAAIVETVFL